MKDTTALFPETYETSRKRFRENLTIVQGIWPTAQLFRNFLPGKEDLTIDWIYAEALEKNEKVLILTTGEHGVEGYVGSAMQQRFIELHMPRFTPKNTGLLLVHAINPWGMKHHRRVNADNVDLNRNFIYDGVFDPAINPDYDKVRNILNPASLIQNLELTNLIFYGKLVWQLARLGLKDFRYATLLGQYRYPRELFYGGTSYQEETRTLIQLYRKAFSTYDQILHLDMHTGYGPRYQMSLVNSALETDTSQEFMEKLNYPLVVAANQEEFYTVQGDMIDYVYTLQQHEFPEKRLYATSFEFGTLGDGLFGLVHSLRAVIHENRLYWHRAANERINKRVKHSFEELFNPSDDDWRAKAVADADQAFDGILKVGDFFA